MAMVFSMKSHAHNDKTWDPQPAIHGVHEFLTTTKKTSPSPHQRTKNNKQKTSKTTIHTRTHALTNTHKSARIEMGRGTEPQAGCQAEEREREKDRQADKDRQSNSFRTGVCVCVTTWRVEHKDVGVGPVQNPLPHHLLHERVTLAVAKGPYQLHGHASALRQGRAWGTADRQEVYRTNEIYLTEVWGKSIKQEVHRTWCIWLKSEGNLSNRKWCI